MGASALFRGQLGRVLGDLLGRAAVWDRIVDVAEALMARRSLTAVELAGLVPAEVAVLGLKLLDETRPQAEAACSGA